MSDGDVSMRSASYTGELQVSPWDAMLSEVRRSAYRAAWIDERIDTQIGREAEIVREATDGTGYADMDDETRVRLALAASRDLREWLDQSRKERAHMANVARAAVSAGLSERYIESVQTEARMIAGVLSRALGAANLSDEQREAANEELRTALAEVGRELQTRNASVGRRIPERPAIEP